MKLRKIGTTALMLACVAFMSLMGSCGKDKKDLAGLFATIPSSTSIVIVVNAQNIYEDLGCTVDGDKITLGKELKDLLNSIGGKAGNKMNETLNEGTGVSMDNFVIFEDDGEVYVTFGLSDEKKFKELLEDNLNTKLDKEDGVEYYRNIAIKDGQAWVCPSSKIDTSKIKDFCKLKEEESFLSVGASTTLLEKKNDIYGWGNINSLLSTAMDDVDYRKIKPMLNIGMGLLFEEGTAVYFDMDFNKGNMTSSLSVLNDKGTPAKCLLPLTTVNETQIKNLGGSSEAVFAMAVSQHLVQYLLDMASSLGGGSSSDLAQAREVLDGIDGTIAVSFSNLMGRTPVFNGVIPTGGNGAYMEEMIQNEGYMADYDGRNLHFAAGNVYGDLSIDEAANLLKGSFAGFVIGRSSFTGSSDPEMKLVGAFLKNMSLTLNPVGANGVEAKLVINTTNTTENVLLQLIDLGMQAQDLEYSDYYDYDYDDPYDSYYDQEVVDVEPDYYGYDTIAIEEGVVAEPDLY